MEIDVAFKDIFEMAGEQHQIIQFSYILLSSELSICLLGRLPFFDHGNLPPMQAPMWRRWPISCMTWDKP